MDEISIQSLSVETCIGVTEQERASKQTLKVSLKISCDTSKVAASDAIEDTIDYEQVANAITNLAATERKTIEKFAEDIATEVLENFGAASVDVTVEKFILPNTEAVSVTIHRP